MPHMHRSDSLTLSVCVACGRPTTSMGCNDNVFTARAGHPGPFRDRTYVAVDALLEGDALENAAQALDFACNGPRGGNSATLRHWRDRARLAMATAVGSLKDGAS